MMEYALKPGDKTTVKAQPGMSADIRLVLDDGTEISTTLAPGIVMKIVSGTRNSININIDDTRSGFIGVVK